VTAHPHDLDHSDVDYVEFGHPRRGPMRRAFSPVVWMGWNIASIVLGGKVREARDRALLNDFEGALAYCRKHEKAIGAKLREI
jgi:hypothetical protein